MTCNQFLSCCLQIIWWNEIMADKKNFYGFVCLSGRWPIHSPKHGWTFFSVMFFHHHSGKSGRTLNLKFLSIETIMHISDRKRKLTSSGRLSGEGNFNECISTNSIVGQFMVQKIYFYHLWTEFEKILNMLCLIERILNILKILQKSIFSGKSSGNKNFNNGRNFNISCWPFKLLGFFNWLDWVK